jgi:oxazoline/thiazoline dehydrogenase
MADASLRLSFAPGVTLVEQHGSVAVRFLPEFYRQPLPLPDVGDGTLATLRRLGSSGVAHAELPDLYRDIRSRDGLAAVGAFIGLLRRLAEVGALWYQIAERGVPFAALQPYAASFELHDEAINEAAPYLLSRFALLRRDGASLLAESGVGKARVVLCDERAASLLTRMSTPRCIQDLRNTDIAEPTLRLLLRLLLSAAVLVMAESEGTGEHHDDRLQLWEFHDMLFHARSRAGRSFGPLGGTYRFGGQTSPLPALQPVVGDVLPLPRPDIDRLIAEDVSFTAVLERRHSRRAHGAEPIDAARLGEFLFRAARVKGQRMRTVATQGGPVDVEVTSRVYPGGGALYELELFLTVAACQDILPGMYRYDPEGHALERVADLGPAARRLLMDARTNVGSPADSRFPQILITCAARFARVAWKYQGMAYALVLKDVGVLYQTMYLVAEAMNLAGCALGLGNADVFADASGQDPLVCASVGEFALGTAIAQQHAHE